MGAAARRAEMQQRLAQFKARKASRDAAGGGGAEAASGAGGELNAAAVGAEGEAGEPEGRGRWGVGARRTTSKAERRSARASGNGADASDGDSVSTAVAFRALQVCVRSTNTSQQHTACTHAHTFATCFFC